MRVQLDRPKRPTQSASPKRVTTPGGPVEPHVGEVIEDQYRIHRKLGEGASAVTYLAEDLIGGSFYVLKRIRIDDPDSKLAKTEFKSLQKLSHPGLPKVYDVRPPSSPFQLRIEYVEGSPLRDLMKERTGRVDFVLRLAQSILDVLEYLESESQIHRDISPGNILIPDDESVPPKLIDFGLSISQPDTMSSVGTPRYRAPEIDRNGRWSCSCDQYSLAVVLFELLTGRLPFLVEDGKASKDTPVKPLPTEQEQFGERLLTVLLRAASADRRKRFRTVSDFSKAISTCLSPVAEISATGSQLINPFVNQLRSAYRNTKLGNASNRGVDDDFARMTYVRTRLDDVLTPALMQGKYRLVLLIGNPGDGKTAYLQNLHAEMMKAGSQELHIGAAGWSLDFTGRTYAALYDASESDGPKRSDDLFKEILSPLSGNLPPKNDDYVAAIAVNDGRLMDFFERHGEAIFPWLWSVVQKQIFGDHEAESGVLVVDLKRRSLVGIAPGATSVFSAVLDAFVDERHWALCKTCDAGEDCPILFNVRSLGKTGLGERVRATLSRMILAVHLRRESRATIRDLRSSLSFLITHDRGCQDVHKDRETGQTPRQALGRLYFQASFDGSGSPDVLLDEFTGLDPASVSSPRLERFFHFHRKPQQASHVRDVFIQDIQRPPSLEIMDLCRASDWVGVMKRWFFFEGQCADEGNRHVFELPAPELVFPYRHMEGFLHLLGPDKRLTDVLSILLQGLGLADGVRAASKPGSLSLRLADNEDQSFVVIKRFKASEFGMRRVGGVSHVVESLTDQLVLDHRDGMARMNITLDFFEFICRTVDGLQRGSEEHKSFLEDLSVFKSQLLRSASREVVLLDAADRSVIVKCGDNGKLILEDRS